MRTLLSFQLLMVMALAMITTGAGAQGATEDTGTKNDYALEPGLITQMAEDDYRLLEVSPITLTSFGPFGKGVVNVVTNAEKDYYMVTTRPIFEVYGVAQGFDSAKVFLRETEELQEAHTVRDQKIYTSVDFNKKYYLARYGDPSGNDCKDLAEAINDDWFLEAEEILSIPEGFYVVRNTWSTNGLMFLVIKHVEAEEPLAAEGGGEDDRGDETIVINQDITQEVVDALRTMNARQSREMDDMRRLLEQILGEDYPSGVVVNIYDSLTTAEQSVIKARKYKSVEEIFGEDSEEVPEQEERQEKRRWWKQDTAATGDRYQFLLTPMLGSTYTLRDEGVKMASAYGARVGIFLDDSVGTFLNSFGLIGAGNFGDYSAEFVEYTTAINGIAGRNKTVWEGNYVGWRTGVAFRQQRMDEFIGYVFYGRDYLDAKAKVYEGITDEEGTMKKSLPRTLDDDVRRDISIWGFGADIFLSKRVLLGLNVEFGKSKEGWEYSDPQIKQLQDSGDQRFDWSDVDDSYKASKVLFSVTFTF
ncbi:hypothetical protein GF367_01555 [Candidatus Woesearchaeota archaeon]|nr:hypothetical protein [Candidatus Woesearchaeota archaeon]